jgi:hypothetical protein
MNSIQYLDAIRARYGVSDYAAAPLIGVSKGAISAVRTNKSGFGEVPALRIAQLLEKNPHEVLAHLRAERAPNEEVKRVWLEIASKFAACVFALYFFAPPMVSAEPMVSSRHHPITGLHNISHAHNINMRQFGGR